MYFEWGTENDLGMIPGEGMSENDRLESEKKKKQNRRGKEKVQDGKLVKIL